MILEAEGEVFMAKTKLVEAISQGGRPYWDKTVFSPARFIAGDGRVL